MSKRIRANDSKKMEENLVDIDLKPRTKLGKELLKQKQFIEQLKNFTMPEGVSWLSRQRAQTLVP